MDKEQIKRARRGAGITQAQAAALFGVTERQWRRYEAGTTPMKPALFSLVFGDKPGDRKRQ